MRLIDVEKLEKYKADCCVSLTEWQEGWNDAIDTIMNETPTVEAIPVEWINTWLNTGRNAKYFIHMMELIKEWEEENGRI